MMTIDDILEQMRDALADEISCTNLTDWSLAASGTDFKEIFNSLSTRDLRDLSQEIQEGLELKVVVDLTDALLAQIEELLDNRDDDEEDSEEDEESLEDPEED